ARSIEMWFHDLKRERSGACGVEGVTAFFQHRHANRSRNPMGRGHDPKRAVDFGPRGEGVGIDLAHEFRIRGLGCLAWRQYIISWRWGRRHWERPYRYSTWCRRPFEEMSGV